MGEMKKELQDLGISTSSFFEKSEFAKAMGEARVDGVAKKEEEVELDVEVLPKSDPGPKKRSSEQSQQQARGSPFGGGGMGGMGGLEDLMKGMGGPFGGIEDIMKGGMPDMAKVQQMMSNPKVREIMGKAQNNPRIMSALSECMSNPAAFAKYQNDPEIRDLLNEIKP